MVSKNRPVFLTPGVISALGDWDSLRATKVVYVLDGGSHVKIKFADNSEETFIVSDITQDDKTDRIAFVSDGVRYTVRSLREQDGQWLSALKTDLPVEALETIIRRGDKKMNTEEDLKAYALEDSPYIVGLVYTNRLGRWSRIDGDWVQLGSGDMTFEAENMLVLPINIEKAAEYMKLYDENFVSVTDTEQYESADSEGDSSADVQSDD